MRSLLLIWFLSTTFIFAQNGKWKLEKNKDGILVYTRKTENSSIKEFKAKTTFKGNLNLLISLLENVDEYPKWQANITSAKIIKRVDSKTNYIYYYSDLPWPIEDRDIVLKSVKSTLKNGAVLFTLSSSPSSYPPKENFIRIKKAKGIWRFTPKENGFIEIIYQSYGDPSGNIPEWLINLFVVEGPYKTLLNLKTLSQPKN